MHVPTLKHIENITNNICRDQLKHIIKGIIPFLRDKVLLKNYNLCLNAEILDNLNVL